MAENEINLDGLDGFQFEELIAKIMKKQGFQNIRVTSKTRDLGRDIIMETPDGNIILIQCKHQQFVGRPVVQKLQGVISYEESRHPRKSISGMIVTSGSFSQDAIDYKEQIREKIGFIDGKLLRDICKELNIIIISGKIQILIDTSFNNISEDKSKSITLDKFHKIYGNEYHKPKVASNVMFFPSVYIAYNVNFDTYTQVGCIDKYSSSGRIMLDGVTGKFVTDDIKKFYCDDIQKREEIQQHDRDKKIHFEFTENDIEDDVFNYVIKNHTHDVHYREKNNVTYKKTCVPKRRDIDILEFLPIYLPIWTNDLNVNQSMKYQQKFYNKGNNQLFILDELKICHICGMKRSEYENMSLCKVCGGIVCPSHIKIDYLDKKTPVCTNHAIALRLFIQNKYFSNKENYSKYHQWWKSVKFTRQLYEDKIALGLIIAGIILTLIMVIFYII